MPRREGGSWGRGKGLSWGPLMCQGARGQSRCAGEGDAACPSLPVLSFLRAPLPLTSAASVATIFKNGSRLEAQWAQGDITPHMSSAGRL